MADGAQLPWKLQKIDASRGPAGDYRTILKPLPPPPEGMHWEKDEKTREVRLVSPSEISSCPRQDGVAVETAIPVAGEEHLRTAEGAVEGVDYAVHTVKPTDTLMGICLAYKTTAVKIRQANRFSGSNLLLAPSRLIIPLTAKSIAFLQDTTSPEYKIKTFRAQFPHLRQNEAKAYLEMSDWDFDAAVENAREDETWEGKQ